MTLAPTIAKLTHEWDSARHGNNGWPLFLEAVTLSGIRGWTGEQIEFRYPVVAISGENGSGKSTILKACASAYRASAPAITVGAVTYSPDDFFPNTPWETVTGVNLDFRTRKGAMVEHVSLRKPTSRWRGQPGRSSRGVFFLDISRIQPANTLIGYGRLAQQAIATGGTAAALPQDQLNMLNRVMSRTYTSGELARDASKQVGILESNGYTYSNFHQGAGEDASLDLIALLHSAPNQSVILIDEAEASLHPKAQRRLITELVRLAFEKKLQIILSTHSSFILEQLPAVARVVVTVDRYNKREILYGASAQYSLSLMDDEYHPELDVYCEDNEAAYIIDALLRREAPEARQRISIVPVGPADVVTTMGRLRSEDRLTHRSVSVLDADQSEKPGCLRLPGSRAPEVDVFRSQTPDSLEIAASRLLVSADDLASAIDDAIQIENHHAWSKQAAKELSPGLRTDRLWEALVDAWAERVLTSNERHDFVQAITDELP